MYFSGKVKERLALEPKRKQQARSFARGVVRRCEKSLGYYPNPVDLVLDRVKCSESCMEARSVAVSKALV